jgi:hypothetical protein
MNPARAEAVKNINTVVDEMHKTIECQIYLKMSKNVKKLKRRYVTLDFQNIFHILNNDATAHNM